MTQSSMPMLRTGLEAPPVPACHDPVLHAHAEDGYQDEEAASEVGQMGRDIKHRHL